MFSAIAMNPNGSCELQSGQSHGEEYTEAAKLLGPDGVTISICDNDYSQGMQFLAQGLQTKVVDSYVIDVPNGKQVASVRLLRAGAPRALVMGADYRISGRNLSFMPGVLMIDDEIEITFR
jgi:hypothetical protein